MRWDGVGEPDRTILVDAQTSGGLLIACPQRRASELVADLRARGVPAASIGAVVEGPAGSITVARK